MSVQVELDVDVVVVGNHADSRFGCSDGEVTEDVSEEVLDEDEVGLSHTGRGVHHQYEVHHGFVGDAFDALFVYLFIL